MANGAEYLYAERQHSAGSRLIQPKNLATLLL